MPSLRPKRVDFCVDVDGGQSVFEGADDRLDDLALAADEADRGVISGSGRLSPCRLRNGVRAAARAFDLEFVPVTHEPYDLAPELE